MSDQATAVTVQRGGWTADDWEEYRGLPWLGRRMADVTRFLPFTERWLAPLIGLHVQHVRRRAYEKARRSAAGKATSALPQGTAASKPQRSLRR